MSEITTLAGRDETGGRPYPLWIERGIFALMVGAFMAFAGRITDWVDHPIAGPFAGYVVYPFTLLALAEMMGRIVQHRHGSKL
jgi:hypothetical protein